MKIVELWFQFQRNFLPIVQLTSREHLLASIGVSCEHYKSKSNCMRTCIIHAITETWGSPWWRHQMEIFSALLAICAGNSPVPGEFLAQRPVTRSFDVFFDLRLNQRLSKQSWGWWFETLPCPLCRHCNDDACHRWHWRLLWQRCHHDTSLGFQWCWDGYVMTRDVIITKM